MPGNRPLARDQDRLTLRENWGQIGTADGDFCIFCRVGAWFFGNSIDVLLIAVFASKGDRGRAQARNGPLPIVLGLVAGGRVNVRAGPGAATAAGCRPLRRRPYRTRCGTRSDALSDAVGHQFRSVGRLGRDQSRQQFPGAAWRPGVSYGFGSGLAQTIRAAAAPRKRPTRRRFGPGGRPTESRPRTGAQGDFVGDQRQTWGGVAGFGARVAPGVNVGISVDQSRTAIDVPLALQSATLDLTQFGFNASVDKGPWTWAIALVHGFGNINSSRDTGVGIASAGYDAQIDGALTELSYYWNLDQSRIVPKAAFEYVRAATGSFQEMGGLDPVSATGATQERSRILLGAEIGHYWIFDQKILDLSAYGKFVDNLTQNFSSITVSLGPQSITVQGIGESQIWRRCRRVRFAQPEQYGASLCQL